MIEPADELTELIGVRAAEDERAWLCAGAIDVQHFASNLTAFEALVPRLSAAYGDALSLRILEGDFPHFTIGGHDFDDLRSAVADQSPLRIDAKLDKSQLAFNLHLTAPNVTTRLFLDRQALVSVLSVPLAQLDTDLFAGVPPGGKLVIILLTDDIDLRGDYLAITSRTKWSGATSAAGTEPTMHARAARQVHWSGAGPKRLTPAHLLVAGDVADGDAVATALYAQLFVLSLMYVAQRTEDKGGTSTCTFAAERQEVEVVAGAVSTPSMVEWSAARRVAALASWIYALENEVEDRFVVVQHTVVDMLQHNSAGTTAAEVLRLADSLTKRAQWAWEAFVGGHLKKYFDQLKALEEAVAATAKDYGEQVSTMTSSLSANVLAAVAVVVGSFLAGLLKTPFADDVFIAGTSLYAVYWLLFPLVLGLGSAKGRFNNTRTNFNTRRANFEERLGKDQVRDIVEPVLAASEPRFHWWFRCTLLIYVAIFLLLVVAILVVPSMTANPDDFMVNAVTVNDPVPGTVTIRGAHFDKRKAIVVTAGRGTFTNVTSPPTLHVYDTTTLTFTPDKEDLGAKIVTIRQGSAGPRTMPVP
jgi:hypothetical protein